MNARDIITAAARKIRVKRVGFALTGEEATDGLSTLNDMIAAWSAEDLLIPYRTRESFTLTAGQQPHTIGTAGDLNTAQPIDIHNAILVSSSTRYPLDTDRGPDDLQQVLNLTTQGLPRWMYFEPGLTLGNLWFDVAPQEAYTLILHSLKRLTEFATLDTDLTLPAETRRAIINNLAVDMAPEYGKDPSQVVIARATQDLAVLKANTAAKRVPLLEYDAATAPHNYRYDIDAGYR